MTKNQQQLKPIWENVIHMSNYRALYKLIILNAIFVTTLVIANVISGKVLQLGPLEVPGAAICYGITFLCTDIIGELYGKSYATFTVKLGLLCQMLASTIILLTGFLPAASYSVATADAYATLLGTNWRFFLASMGAYWISQGIDLAIFHKLRIATGGNRKWLRNNCSTLVSQFVDTAIFITLAFYGTVPNLGVMIVSQYVLKMIIALLDTPIFYLCTRQPKD